MKKFKSPLFQIFFAIGMVLINIVSLSWATGVMTSQEPVRIAMQLGNKDGDLRFSPDSLELETGRLYLLNLTNPSDKKHYFS
ncbi:MAG: hypothetical protein G3M70_11640 [Candidatus Nitronauta litoralis]|uniref:Uncharacterized protein n=1 Tax=Candidatus Nitronauta litoralis TaxID=2705533 RepID=A0A7T0BX00_9BACT|nr:MAG: hypothetical protein G3M70_11640 [Candidatus Nitronauta litoralis]